MEAEYKKLYVKGWDKLLTKLKQYGGVMINPQPEAEEQVKGLINEGRIFDASKLRFQLGKIGGCHENSFRTWAETVELQLVRGYALDGEYWNQHSWLWNPGTGEMIETTLQYEKYFGVVADGYLALELIDLLIPGIEPSFKKMFAAAGPMPIDVNYACRELRKHLRENKDTLLPQDDASQMISYDSIDTIQPVGWAVKTTRPTHLFVNRDHWLAELSRISRTKLSLKDGTTRTIENGSLVIE